MTAAKRAASRGKDKPPSKPTPAQAPALVVLNASLLPEGDRADVGSRYSFDKLLGHAVTALSKVTAPFAAFGYDDAWRASMRALLQQLELVAAHKDAVGAESVPTGAALDAAVSAAKAWRRDAGTVLALLPEVDHHAFRLGSGSSAKALERTLTEALPYVKPARVTPYGTGAQMRDEGKRRVDALKAARKAHKEALAKLSPEARAVQALKGTLYEELKNLARVARNVAPTEAHLFAVGTHVRSNHHHAKPPAAPAAAGAAP